MTYEGKMHAHSAKREHMHQTEQQKLSETADQHATPLVVALEIDRVCMAVQNYASIPELHDLRWTQLLIGYRRSLVTSQLVHFQDYETCATRAV